MPTVYVKGAGDGIHKLIEIKIWGGARWVPIALFRKSLCLSFKMNWSNKYFNRRGSLKQSLPWERIIVPLDWHFVVYPGSAVVDEGAGVDEGAVPV